MADSEGSRRLTWKLLQPASEEAPCGIDEPLLRENENGRLLSELLRTEKWAEVQTIENPKEALSRYLYATTSTASSPSSVQVAKATSSSSTDDESLQAATSETAAAAATEESQCSGHVDVAFEVACSKGTYIRSIAESVGEWLRCGGYLLSLDRSAVGEIERKHGWTAEELTAFARQFALPFPQKGGRRGKSQSHRERGQEKKESKEPKEPKDGERAGEGERWLEKKRARKEREAKFSQSEEGAEQQFS